MTWFPYRRFNEFASGVPMVYVEVQHSTKSQSFPIPMLIDTGATYTTVPLQICTDVLGIMKITERHFYDFDGTQIIKPIFVINFVIEENLFKGVEVIGTNNQYYGLLGRDLLSRYMLRCDGPAQKFELDYQHP